MMEAGRHPFQLQHYEGQDLMKSKICLEDKIQYLSATVIINDIKGRKKYLHKSEPKQLNNFLEVSFS